MTEEQMKRKIEQQRAKAPPPGTSRILSRATREQKKQHKPVIPTSAKPIVQEPKKEVNKKPETTPTPRQTNVNNEQIGVKSVNTAVEKQNNMTKLNAETKTVVKVAENNHVDADEWQNLLEELDPGESRPLF